MYEYLSAEIGEALAVMTAEFRIFKESANMPKQIEEVGFMYM
jgi:hypothetical protein